MSEKQASRNHSIYFSQDKTYYSATISAVKRLQVDRANNVRLSTDLSKYFKILEQKPYRKNVVDLSTIDINNVSIDELLESTQK